MDAEIRPEPSPAERRAIIAALELELSDELDPRGRWWRAGLRQSLRPAEAASQELAERPGERVPPPGE